MKKTVYSIAVLLTSLFISRNTYAMWPDLTPLIPLAPQLCAMCTPPAVLTAMSYVQQVNTIKDDLTKFTDMSQLRQMATSYAPKLGATTLNAWRQRPSAKKKIISFSRTIEECKVADINDEASVKEAFIKLFLQYPSKKNSVKAAYREIGEQLKMDTTLEMFITAKEMEKELLGKEPGKEIEPTAQNLADLGFLKQIDLIESCLVEGKNCDVIGLDACMESKNESKSEEGEEDDEDHVCFWNSALQAEKFYDVVMRYNEFLVSMHAQYQAVMGIENLAKILEKKEKYKEKDYKKDLQELENNIMNGAPDKTSSLQYLSPAQNYAANTIFANAVFADMSDAEMEKQIADDLKDYDLMLSTHENTMGGEFEEIKKATGYNNVLDGRDEDLKSMQTLAEVQEYLNKAMRIHNLKQMLPGYRRVYKDYNDAVKQHDLALQNMEVSGTCIVDMLRPYYSDAAKAWHGNDCQYYNHGKLICHYLPERDFDENEPIKDGDFDTACPGDEGHRCYVISFLDESAKAKGISGYLTTLYAKAKDMDATSDMDSFISAVSDEGHAGAYVTRTAITSNFAPEDGGNTDMYVVTRDNDAAATVTGGKALLTQALTPVKDRVDDSSSTHLKKQRQGEAEKENMRKDGVLRWVLGSIVAKDVAEDLDAGTHDFGNRIKKFPLWTDQKEFYEQYIDGKYANIKEYIATMPTAEILLNLAADLNIVYPYEDIYVGGVLTQSAEEQRTENGQKISSALAGVTTPETNEEEAMIATKLADENAEFAAIHQAYQADIANLIARRESIYDALDRNNAKLSEQNEEYNKNNAIIKDADATSGEANAAIEYGNDLYKNRNLTADAPQNTKAQDNPEVIGFKTKNTRNASAKSEAIAKKSVAGNTAELEAQSKAYEQQLADIKNEIEARRILYVKNLSDAEIATREKFAAFSQILKDARVLNNAIDSSISSIIPVDLAAGLVKCVREYALTQVDVAKENLDMMKPNEELYRAESAGKVNTIHTEMIKKITSISPEDLATCPVIGQIREIGGESKNLEKMLNIFSAVCQNGMCEKADNEYFVGALGLPRDFMAPNRAVEFSSAPLREIFHFDVYDYNNLAKFYDGNIKDVQSNLDLFTSATNVLEFLDKGSLLSEHGSTVPEIWRKILTRHAFVQKEIDLVKLLSGSEEITNSTRKALSRSGVFPCKIGRHIIDVSLNLDYMVDETRDADKYYDLPTCKGLKIETSHGKSVVMDEEAGGGNVNHNPPGFIGNVVRSSELGNILSYVPDKEALLNAKKLTPFLPQEAIAALPHRLTFNANLMRAVKKIVETENVGEEGHEDEDSLFYLANRVMMERNQFGDYLDQVENESVVADQLAKLEKQIYDIRMSLLDIFMDTGFELGDDFDLTKPDDYAAAEDKLDQQKDIYLKQSVNKLSEVNGTSQMVSDKIGKLLMKISILGTDKDEVVAVTGEESIAELEEKIAAGKADNAVGEELTKEKEKAAEQQLQRYRRPYCAVYPR